jgi:phage terminase large subunit-like protein
MIALPDGITVEEVRAVAYSMSEDEARALWYDWDAWARPEQMLPAGDWLTWLVLAGRGFGKTRSGAEAVRAIVCREPGIRIALIGPTAADCRDVMVEGESGIKSVFPNDETPEYLPSKRLLRFANGSMGFVYSAEEPERLRGPQHHYAYCDELAVYPDPEALWDNLQFGLRLGTRPRVIVTTTPKPLPFLKKLIAEPSTVVTRGSTFDNNANLPAATLDYFRRVYGGTRIGRQELNGEVLDEAEGALWRRTIIDQTRVRTAPDMQRIVIAIDPAVTSGENSDETGIVAAGLGIDNEAYVLADKTCKLPPDQWASRAISLFDALDGDRVIAETNNGGDLVESVLRTVRRNIAYEKITASRGKVVRAEPVAALYEQGRVHHVGAMPDLEDEMVNFVPGALSYLMLKPRPQGRAIWVG